MTKTEKIKAIHNIKVVQSQKGWTKRDALEAVADASRGLVYGKNPKQK